MFKKGVYAASLSVLNENYSLNITATIKHAEDLIKNGLHGAFIFGSTGQSQLISLNEKKELISKLSESKFKNNFFLGTGCNSLRDTFELIKYSLEYNFNYFLIMPPAYYKGNTDEGVFRFYSQIIKKFPKVKIILYNFEKLSGYKFSEQSVKNLVEKYPKNIVGCKDSSYNLFETLKIKNFLVFPGSEAKLLQGLELGCAGCISAVTNVTHSLARKVFDDFNNQKPQTQNEKLIDVRKTFDQFNLIPALHCFMSQSDKSYSFLLPPLINLNSNDEKELIKNLKKLKFSNFNQQAA